MTFCLTVTCKAVPSKLNIVKLSTMVLKVGTALVQDSDTTIGYRCCRRFIFCCCILQAHLYVLRVKEVVAEVSPQRRGEEVGDAEGEEGEADLGDAQVELLKVVLQAGLQQTLDSRGEDGACG